MKEVYSLPRVIFKYAAFLNGKRNGEGVLTVGSRYRIEGTFKDNYVEGGNPRCEVDA